MSSGTEPLLPAGAYCALVTPLQDDGELDSRGLARLLDHVLAGSAGGIGVRGVAPVGSTGEGTLLSRRIRRAVVEQVVASVPSGMAVTPGVVATGIEETLADLDTYAKLGASAALLPPPNYYLHGPEETENFYTVVADHSPLPVVMYNIPRLTKVPISPEVSARLASHRKIVGLKDSSGDLENLVFLREMLPRDAEFRIFTGTDTLLMPSLMMGAAGTIAASINLSPSLAVGICAAMAGGRLEEAEALQRQLALLVERVRRLGTPGGWKVALEALGICAATPAAPRQAPSANDVLEMAKDLETLGIALS